MAAEREPRGESPGDEFDKIIAFEFPEASEENVIGHANALIVFDALEKGHERIPMGAYKERLEATPISSDVFAALRHDLKEGILLTVDKPEVAEAKVTWLNGLASMLPVSARERQEFEQEGIDLPPGRIRPPYESKVHMQIDIVRDPLLNRQWKEALVKAVDGLVLGISLTDFTPEEQGKIVRDRDMRSIDNHSLVPIYQKYAQKELVKALEAYAQAEGFTSAIPALAKILVESYAPLDTGAPNAERAEFIRANYHLRHMGLTIDHQAVKEAMERADTLLAHLRKST